MDQETKKRVMEHIRQWPEGFKMHTLQGPISKEFALAEVEQETELGHSIIEIEKKVIQSEELGFHEHWGP